MMKCKRCGSGCPHSPDGFCFHCQIAVELEKTLGKSLKDAGIAEGFPDWRKPTKKDKESGENLKQGEL